MIKKCNNKEKSIYRRGDSYFKGFSGLFLVGCILLVTLFSMNYVSASVINQSAGRSWIIGDTFADQSAAATNRGSSTNFTSQVWTDNSPVIDENMTSYILINTTSHNKSEFTYLQLYVYVQSNLNPANALFQVYYCNDTFDESTLTWNNQFTEVADCATTPLYSKSLGHMSVGWKAFDILNETLYDDDGIFTLRLYVKGEMSDSQRNAVFRSKEYTGTTFDPFIYGLTNDSVDFNTCDVLQTPTFLNITFQDEDSLDFINGSIRSNFRFWGTDQNQNRTLTFINDTENYNYEFCGAPENATINIQQFLSFDSPGYQGRNWQSVDSLTNTTTDQILFLLNASLSSDIFVEIVDQGLTPFQGLFVEIKRFYPGLNEYKTVIQERTDVLGRFVAQLVENYVKYEVIMTNSNGTVVQTEEEIVVACRNVFCILSLVVEDSTDDFARFDNVTNFEYNLTFNNVTNTFNVSWIDSTGTAPTLNLVVERITLNGTSTVCDKISVSLDSSLFCAVGSSKASYRAQFFRNTPRIAVLNIKVGETFGTYGLEGLIWAFLFLFTLIGIGVFNPTIAALLYGVGFMFLGILGIISFSIPVIFANILIIGIFIWAFRG